MIPTIVVNIRQEAYDVDISRRGKWGNPFLIGKDGDRQQVIEKYRVWIQRKPYLLDALGELVGQRLGCWCKPEACHGDVLRELVTKK